MPRPRRQFHADTVYHVISRGSSKAAVFRDPADYETYLRMLLEAKERYKVEIFHYVLMPNHVHLLVRPSAKNGSDFMRMLNSNYAKYVCKKRKKIGHVWKNRFGNLPVHTDAYLLACGNYIEMNPVRWGLTADPQSWPYSSYRYYAEGADNPIVDCDPLYLDFGKNPKVRKAAYQKWIGTTRAS